MILKAMQEQIKGEVENKQKVLKEYLMFVLKEYFMFVKPRLERDEKKG